MDMSSSSMPTSFILSTYCIEPVKMKPTYTRLSTTASIDTALRLTGDSILTSASTPMCEPTRTP